MLLSVVSIIANTIYYIILNIRLYTDRAAMPDGTIKKWHRSPAARLAIADQSALLYIQLVLMSLCMVTGLLIIFGVKNQIIRVVSRISMIASSVMFIIIMIVTANIHVKYA